MPRGTWSPITKNDLRDRIKEIEERIKQMDRRERMLGDLKKWLKSRKLDYTDLHWMTRQMKPARADKPVKSKKPLTPPLAARKNNIKQPKGDPDFRRAVREARMDQKLSAEELGKKIGVSVASINNWEVGRYVPTEASRVKVLKALSLPAHLGAEATKAMAVGGANGRGG